MSNLGSWPLPWDWNGPDSLRVIGPCSCEFELLLTSIFSDRSSWPESTLWSPVNVFVIGSMAVGDSAPAALLSPALHRARASAARPAKNSGNERRVAVVGSGLH